MYVTLYASFNLLLANITPHFIVTLSISHIYHTKESYYKHSLCYFLLLITSIMLSWWYRLRLWIDKVYLVSNFVALIVRISFVNKKRNSITKQCIDLYEIIAFTDVILNIRKHTYNVMVLYVKHSLYHCIQRAMRAMKKILTSASHLKVIFRIRAFRKK